VQPQDPHPHITIFYAIWAAVGPLIGLMVGAWLQARGQHQQWRRDLIRQECRELLGQLSVNLFAFIDWRRSILGRDVGPQAAIFAKQYGDAVLDLHRNFRSRILIADELKRASIPNRWNAALDSFDGDFKKLNAEYDQLAEEIVQIGLKV
jgi:hypothetical protein